MMQERGFGWRDPPGMPAEPAERVQVRCPSCGFTWQVLMRRDHGMLFPQDEDDMYCAECDAEGRT